MLSERYSAGHEGKRRGAPTKAAHTKNYLLTGMLRCGGVQFALRRRDVDEAKAERHVPPKLVVLRTSRTRGPTVCTHTAHNRKDVIEFALVNRAEAAMTRRNLDALATAITTR